MTATDLIHEAGRHPWFLAAVFVSLPAIAWVLGRMHPRGQGGMTPWRYAYGALVYLSCVPGILSAVLTGYVVFFTRQNLLKVDLLVHVLPVASMVVTLLFIRRSVPFAEVPGFGRLSGLMLIMGCSFAVALALEKTAIRVFVGVGIGWLFLLAGAAFVVLMFGAHLLVRRRTNDR